MYQEHSETSREAWHSLTTAGTDEEKIYNLILSRGTTGISAPWVARTLGITPGTVAARVVGLERDKRVVRMERSEKSPNKRPANILVADVHVAALPAGDKILTTKPEGTADDAPAREMAQLLYDALQLTRDNGGKIILAPLDMAVVENLAVRAGLKKN